MDVQADKARYEADRAKDVRLSAAARHRRSHESEHPRRALFPGPAAPRIAARPGYPTVIVPFAMVPNAPTAPAAPFPKASTRNPPPSASASPAWPAASHASLALAYAFEQATKKQSSALERSVTSFSLSRRGGAGE